MSSAVFLTNNYFSSGWLFAPKGDVIDILLLVTAARPFGGRPLPWAKPFFGGSIGPPEKRLIRIDACCSQTVPAIRRLDRLMLVSYGGRTSNVLVNV